MKNTTERASNNSDGEHDMLVHARPTYLAYLIGSELVIEERGRELWE